VNIIITLVCERRHSATAIAIAIEIPHFEWFLPSTTPLSGAFSGCLAVVPLPSKKKKENQIKVAHIWTGYISYTYVAYVQLQCQVQGNCSAVTFERVTATISTV